MNERENYRKFFGLIKDHFYVNTSHARVLIPLAKQGNNKNTMKKILVWNISFL